MMKQKQNAQVVIHATHSSHRALGVRSMTILLPLAQYSRLTV